MPKLLDTRQLVPLGRLLTGLIPPRPMLDITRSSMTFLIFAKVHIPLRNIWIVSATDELSLIQQPMSDREILGCLLDGLDLDYDVVVNTVHTSPSATTLKARHLSRHISVFFSTTGPGINPVSFTRSRFPDGQAAYNTCTFWTPTQEARQQPRRDLSEFS